MAKGKPARRNGVRGGACEEEPARRNGVRGGACEEEPARRAVCEGRRMLMIG